MGTSTDSCGRQESSGNPVIPWKCVSFCIVNKLVQLLNTDSMFGKDWRGLASRLGYSTAVILSIESSKSNNTEELFRNYVQEPNASFNQVFSCLQDMERTDCLDILTNHFDEIKQAYHRERQQVSSSFRGAEMHHSPSSGRYWSSHHPAPSYMCGYMSQPMTAPPAFSPHHCCSMAHAHGYPGDPCSPMPPTHHHHHPPMPLSAYPCVNHAPSHSPKPMHYSCSQAPGYYPSHLQMNVQLDTIPGSKHPENAPSTSHSRNGFPETCVAASSSPGGMQLPGMMSQNQLYNRSDSQKSYEDNTLLPLPHNISPQEISSDFSNASNNSWRPMDTSLSQSQTSLLSNNSNSNSNVAAAAAAATQRPYNAPEYRDYNRMRVDSKESLEKLVQISKVPEEYQPTEEYTRVVAEQKIAEKKNNKSYRNNNDRHTPSIASGSSTDSSRSSGSRSGAHAAENSNTFPLRAKIQPNDITKDIASISIKKSPSLPQSYKSQEYQKIHGTRLFITYSSDSEEHKADILSLCVFLKDNHFKSYVDVKDTPQAEQDEKSKEYLSRFQAADHILMCISPKYLKDISKSGAPHPSERQLHTYQIFKQMHREHVEGQANRTPLSQPRAVILLFGSVSSGMLPEWMRKYPTYKWPSDYEDLFWMLMKPQDRIKANCGTSNTDKKAVGNHY